LAWGSRVEVVEIHNYIWRMDIIVRGPAIVSTVVALPLDKILETAPVDAAIEDLLHLEFLITLNYDWWRWWLGLSTGDGIICRREELHDWEHWVEVSERRG
jgi:hypothetical protein